MNSANLPQVSAARLEQLRRDATKLRRSQPGLAQHEALDQIAQNEGYKNWSLLSKHVGTAPASAVAKQVPAGLPPRSSEAADAAKLRKILIGPRMDATRDEHQLIIGIMKRYFDLVGDIVQTDRLSVMMDLEACHCNGCPLDLISLLEAASDLDLVHDVAGIGRHLNRDTGKLEDYFLPRYASREKRIPVDERVAT